MGAVHPHGASPLRIYDALHIITRKATSIGPPSSYMLRGYIRIRQNPLPFH